MASETQLYGKPAGVDVEGYKSPKEYADQGDTRIVRDLSFSFLVAVPDAGGTVVLQPRDVPRNTELSVSEMGVLALELGERHHSFYTSEELKRLKSTGSETEPVEAEANLSELGSFELAEWLATKNPDTGRVWTINDVLERVGDDKDLANRMLEAENVRAGDDDPREGLTKGLTAIIEREPQQ